MSHGKDEYTRNRSHRFKSQYPPSCPMQTAATVAAKSRNSDERMLRNQSTELERIPFISLGSGIPEKRSQYHVILAALVRPQYTGSSLSRAPSTDSSHGVQRMAAFTGMTVQTISWRLCIGGPCLVIERLLLLRPSHGGGTFLIIAAK